MDRRFDIMKERLGELTHEELECLHEGIIEGKVCYDDFNYDVRAGKFCPLAVAIGLDKMKDPSDLKVWEELYKRFKPVNVLKGVPGNFYHGNTEERESDLLGLVNVLRK